MLPNIYDHSVQVMRLALALADNLRDRASVNRGLIEASALLHDIAKTRTISTGELRHDLIGGEIIRGLGYSEVAVIVEAHVFFGGFMETGPLEERELVYYADKRVMHDRVVSIDERIDDLVVRYGKTQLIIDRIVENRDFIIKVEKKIESFMRISADEAVRVI